jgi:hypothetical protein
VHRYLYSLVKGGKQVRIWWEPGEIVHTPACDTIMDRIVLPVVFSGFDAMMPVRDMDINSSVGTIPEQYSRDATPTSTVVAAFTNRSASAAAWRDRLRTLANHRIARLHL